MEEGAAELLARAREGKISEEVRNRLDQLLSRCDANCRVIRHSVSRRGALVDRTLAAATCCVSWRMAFPDTPDHRCPRGVQATND